MKPRSGLTSWPDLTTQANMGPARTPLNLGPQAGARKRVELAGHEEGCRGPNAPYGLSK